MATSTINQNDMFITHVQSVYPTEAIQTNQTASWKKGEQKLENDTKKRYNIEKLKKNIPEQISIQYLNDLTSGNIYYAFSIRYNKLNN